VASALNLATDDETAVGDKAGTIIAVRMTRFRHGRQMLLKVLQPVAGHDK